MRLPSYQDLSKEQDRINSLPLEGSYLVTGPPGTGKTVMALYRSQMLNKRKADVRLLMYSRLLSQYTETAIDELGIDGLVTTFHSWFYNFYRGTYRKSPPQHEPYVYDWTEVLNTVTADPPPADSLPYLLIDEGQDLPEHFYMVARHIAKNLTVFADENQRLTDHNSTLQAIGRRAGIKDRHELRRNYRNTYEIAALAAEFCTGLSTGVPDLPDRRGDKPRLMACEALHVAVDFIARYERNHTDREIGVLLPTTKLQKQFVNRLEPKTTNRVQVYYGGKGKAADVLDFDSPGIKVVNYKSAKGLEFDTVFLPELQVVTDDPAGSEFKMKFYVLVSRARDELFLLYSGDEPRMIKTLPRDLLEWP